MTSEVTLAAQAVQEEAGGRKTAEQLTDEIFEILFQHRPHYTPHSPSTYQEILNLIAQELP